MKRKKRLERGVKSLEDQIKIHEEKKQKAIELGQEELVRYYEKEINKLVGVRKRKKDLLNKQ
ncbi:hypothetical protein HYV50_02190 [Candidatus Pacearchaeota archaeon]|nr:hypothetical protein [Candidatus Pacearchaeota archaeon]